MKKRSVEILQKVLQNPYEELNIQKLMDVWHKTEKTLRNDIQEIFDFLYAHEVRSVLSFDGQILKVSEYDNIGKVIDILNNINFYHYRMSLDERKFYIIAILLNQTKYYSMQQLANEMFVTRNTIVEDCKVVNEYLKKHGIEFIAKSKKGIRIEGREEQIYQLLINIFSELLPNSSNEKYFFTQQLIKKIDFFYSLLDISIYIESYTKDHSILFAKDSFQYVALCMFVLINRIHQGRKVKTRIINDNQLPLDTIGFIVQHVLSKLNCHSLDRNDIMTIERIILEGQLTPRIQSVNDFELYGVICHFLLEISSKIHIDLQSDELLIRSLISHVKSMCNWNDTDFDMDDENGSFEFLELRSLAESKYCILEKYLQYSMNQKMKNSIIIHVCAALLRNRQNMEPYNVIISCPGSMATSKYLEAQIKNHFNFNIVDIMTTRQIESSKGQFDNVDFIISTVNIQDCFLPVVVVSPLIAFDDINKIQRLTFNKKIPNKMGHLQKYPLLSRIYSSYKSNDKEKISFLNQELTKVLQKLEQKKTIEEKSSLLKMLELKYINITDQKLDWKDAMKLAAEDLIKAGFFEESYLREAIDNVEEYGAYIIISNCIALAHGSKSSGVYNDSISLLVAKNGIFFDDGQKVNLLFFFSQNSNLNYMGLFNELIQLGKNKDNISKITSFNTQYDVYHAIKEVLLLD